MRMKIRKLKRKLGVSTVVANMLMILITLSLAAILVAWAGTTYGAFSGGSSLFFQQRGQALQERFVIEEVFFNKTAKTILLFVRNVGAQQINLVAIYVNGTLPSQNDAHAWLCKIPSGGSVLLTIQAVCEFNLAWSSGWNSGSIFNIVVASARGNQVTSTVRAP
jgi:archaellum component FlaF (FlaF/FlaG flagellin family)